MKSLIVILFLTLVASSFSRDMYEELQAGGKTYTQVLVLSSNESSLSIKHSRGISQIALADLSPSLQTKYGYRSSADEARSRRLDQMRREQAEETKERIQKMAKVALSRSGNQNVKASRGVQRAFAQFGVAPRLSSELDLRSRFRGHGISIREQRGPSCSVHAIAAALEYQFAEEKGQKINVSERYLVEATSRTLGRRTKNDFDSASIGGGVVEEGFTLEQVFQAIRGNGLALEFHNGKGFSEISLPKEFENINFSPFQIPGAQTKAGMANLVHVLNAQMPVVVGVGWPSDARVRNTALLSKQPPALGAGHAVTIVGYRCPTGKIEDTKFIFRNSWGAKWGAGGYGFFTYEYLLKNLWSCYVVELR